MLGFHPSRLAEEGQEDQPPRIEARQQRGEGADPPRDLAAVARREAHLEHRVLRMEARKADRRQTTDPRQADAGDRKRTRNHRPEGHRDALPQGRSEEHTSELQSLMRISYAVFCLKKTTHVTMRTHTWPLNGCLLVSNKER